MNAEMTLVEWPLKVHFPMDSSLPDGTNLLGKGLHRHYKTLLTWSEGDKQHVSLPECIHFFFS